MKKILSPLVVLILIITSCKSNAQKFVTKDVNEKFVVVLDLSDRLLYNNNQKNTDIAAILAFFSRFEEKVKSKLYIKSKEKFSIRILKQRNTPLNIDSIENCLQLNLETAVVSEKRIQTEKFKTSLEKKLIAIYNAAIFSKTAREFKGVDIWAFFNADISNELAPNYTTSIMVLTDGYFDFEDPAIGLRNKQQSTITAQLLPKLQGINWKQTADANNIGLIPVKMDTNMKMLVVGIQPKTNDILANEKLIYLWQKWIKQSGGKLIAQPIVNASSSVIANKINTVL
jgi:hypothetical protein